VFRLFSAAVGLYPVQFYQTNENAEYIICCNILALSQKENTERRLTGT